MHAVIQLLHSLFGRFSNSLHSFFAWFLNLPHHLMAYAAIPAILLIGIPLMRLAFGSRRRSEGSSSEGSSSLNAASPSMLGLSSPSIDFKPAPIERMPLSNVRAINESLTVPCIHCGATMSSRQNFCPACSYAQPMKRTFTA